MILILLAAAAVAAHSAPPRTMPSRPQTEAETVLDRQRRQPPRRGRAAGLSPEEASVVMSHYLGAIGRPLPGAADSSGAHP
jgi:hypothetical protein